MDIDDLKENLISDIVWVLGSSAPARDAQRENAVDIADSVINLVSALIDARNAPGRLD